MQGCGGPGGPVLRVLWKPGGSFTPAIHYSRTPDALPAGGIGRVSRRGAYVRSPADSGVTSTTGTTAIAGTTTTVGIT